MVFQSKIYLKGDKEPLLCSEKSATHVQKLFTDAEVPYDHQITVARCTFTKADIRRVFVEKDRDDLDTGQKCHWIIYNPKRNTVWKNSYPTYEAAKAELDFQETTMPEGYTHGWVIEKRVQPV